jgi:WD40 repeat protein
MLAGRPAYTAAMSEDSNAENSLRVFAQRMRDRRAQAGAPSLRTLEKLTKKIGQGYPRTTISDKLTGKSFPDWEFVKAFLAACALPGVVEEDDLQEWRTKYQEVRLALAKSRAGRRRAAEVAEQLVRDTGEPWLVNLLLQQSTDRLPPSAAEVSPSSIHSRRVMTLTGHTGWVAGLAFSPDGTLLATSGGDATVRIWETATGTTVRGLTTHSAPVRSVAFSPDGSLLASASDDRTVRVWETSTGSSVQVLTGHTSGAMAVAFSPDGTTLASAGLDQTVRVWDAATGIPVRTLTGHTGEARSIAFSPDGSLLASASDDRTVRVWEISTGTEVRVLTGHTGPLRCVTFSPDGILLASAAHDQTVRVWEAATGKPVHTLADHAAGVNGVSFSPDGSLLAVAIHGWDQTVRMLATATWKQERALAVNHKAYSVAFSPDGSLLATSGWDTAVRLWEI